MLPYFGHLKKVQNINHFCTTAGRLFSALMCASLHVPPQALQKGDFALARFGQCMDLRVCEGRLGGGERVALQGGVEQAVRALCLRGWGGQEVGSQTRSWQLFWILPPFLGNVNQSSVAWICTAV